jgi:hypothetical protein
MLSLQSQFVYLLLGDKGTFLDVGCGNMSGEPCSSNTAWLYDLGWRGMGMELNETWAKEAKEMFAPESIILQGDCLSVDWKKIFDDLEMPKVFDYVSIDIDHGSAAALHRFLNSGYKAKILMVEHDRYSVGGEQRKALLEDLMEYQIDYRMVVENVGLSFCTKNYLENWWINSETDFLIPEIHNMFWKEVNPNQIIFDLCKVKKW